MMPIVQTPSPGQGLQGALLRAWAVAVPASQRRAGAEHGLAQTWAANGSSRAWGGDARGSEAGLGAAPRPQMGLLGGEAHPPARLLTGFTPWHGGSWSLRSHPPVEEPPRGAGSSAGTSLNHHLSCLQGVQKLLPVRSSRSPRSTPGFSSLGHRVWQGWEVICCSELKTKPRVPHPRLLETSHSSPNARKTWTGMKGKGLLTPADL